MTSIKTIFQKFISDKIPRKQTNIFWMLFNGIQEMFNYLETNIKIIKRERNILTATNTISLRNLAAQNGFEPKLKVPSSGILYIKVNPKLFNRVGFPLYLKPYSIFTCSANKLTYYFNSEKSLKIENDVVLIPVVEGELKTINFVSSGAELERIYLDNSAIAENSLVVKIGTVEFTEVKSFFDNQNLYNNKQFLFKYSNNLNKPLVIYVKGSKLNEVINLTYKLTSGEFGNLLYKSNFETENIMNSQGEFINISDDEITIYNESGFNFGSNGTDVNSLRASIGYNHGVNLLFDTISYRNYIGKFSNILLQKIKLSESQKSINNIYISKKQYINTELTNLIKEQYQKIINFKSYLFSDDDLKIFDNLLSDNEYALSSHNLNNSEINKFAIQLLFKTISEKDKFSLILSNLIYSEFSKFLYDKNHLINFEVLFNNFMIENNTIFEYTIFNSDIELEKIQNQKEINTPYIINHDDKLPILLGDFVISDLNYNPINLFFDINIVSNNP